MRRCSILILGMLLAFPAVAPAQESPQLPRSRISITPFFGYRFQYTANGEFTVMTPDSIVVDVFDVNERHGGGTAAGAQLELRVLGPLSLVGAVAYSRPGEVKVTLQSLVTDSIQEEQRRGPELWLYKAGLSFRLPDPTPDSRSFHPAAFLTIAPALIRETRDAWPFIPANTESVDHYALSIGGEAVTPLGAPWIALFLSVEDFIVFWNRTQRERAQEREFLDQEAGGPTIVDFTYGDPSHIIMLRAGISLRFF